MDIFCWNNFFILLVLTKFHVFGTVNNGNNMDGWNHYGVGSGVDGALHPLACLRCLFTLCPYPLSIVKLLDLGMIRVGNAV